MQQDRAYILAILTISLNSLMKTLWNLTFVVAFFATPVRDTMKRSHQQDNHIEQTVERTTLWHALTPQFSCIVIKQNIENALSQKSNDH